jgi:hypothetical protein
MGKHGWRQELKAAACGKSVIAHAGHSRVPMAHT